MGPTPPLAADARWATVEVAAGVRFLADLGNDAEDGDSISRALAAGNYPLNFQLLFRLLTGLTPRGGRVLDLGAHVGAFSLAAAAAGFEVVAVDASPRNAALLRNSAQRNNFASMRVVQVAVSDRPGAARFHANGPFGFLITPANAVADAVIDVTTLSGAALLDQVGWDRVDFIKLDIEGSEVAALRGLLQLLSGPSAPTIVTESNGPMLESFGHSPRTLKAMLEAAGYRNYWIEIDRLIPVRPRTFQPQAVVDYLACKTRPEQLHLDGWRVEPRMGFDETLARTLAAINSPEPPEHRYMTSTLASAPWSIRRAVRRRRDLLADDARG